MRLTYNAVDYGIIDSSVLVESGHFNHRLVLATKTKKGCVYNSPNLHTTQSSLTTNVCLIKRFTGIYIQTEYSG